MSSQSPDAGYALGAARRAELLTQAEQSRPARRAAAAARRQRRAQRLVRRADRAAARARLALARAL